MNSTAAHRQPTVLITGASSGLGMACALEMDRLGWQVFATVRQQTAADRLVEQARSDCRFSRLTTLMLDVTEPDSIACAAAEVHRRVGQAGLDGLVNNAGIAVSGPLEIVPIQRLRQQLEINLIGQVAVTQAMLPMLRTARGRIVNMGSVSGLMSAPYLGPYCMSKFALEAFCDALRLELAGWGVSVSLIEPVSITSNIWDKALGDIEQLKSEASPAARELYAKTFEKMLQVTEHCQRTALPAAMVTKAVRHALTARRPKSRYLVARPLGKLLFPLFCSLPDRLRDWVVRRLMA